MTTNVTPSFPDLRLGPSGPLVTSVGGGAGDGLEPIQNVRFLDPDFVSVTPNGSIQSPWESIYDFLAEATGSDAAWQLNLPANLAPSSVSIPDLIDTGDITFQGVSQSATDMGSVTIDTQSDSPSHFYFRSLKMDHLGFNSQTDIRVTLENVTIRNDITFDGGTVTGELRAINCDLTSIVWFDGSSAAVARIDESILRGLNNSIDGELRDCEIAANATFTFRQMSLSNCTFGAGVVFTADSPGNVLTVDSATLSSMLDNGVTVDGDGIVEVSGGSIAWMNLNIDTEAAIFPTGTTPDEVLAMTALVGDFALASRGGRFSLGANGVLTYSGPPVDVEVDVRSSLKVAGLVGRIVAAVSHNGDLIGITPAYENSLTLIQAGAQLTGPTGAGDTSFPVNYRRRLTLNTGDTIAPVAGIDLDAGGSDIAVQFFNLTVTPTQA